MQSDAVQVENKPLEYRFILSGALKGTFRRTCISRTTVVPIRGHEPLVKLEAVFAHGELDRVQAGLFNVQVDLVRLTTVHLLGSLLTLPTPRFLSFAPLQALTGGGPGPVNAYVQTVVFTAR